MNMVSMTLIIDQYGLRMDITADSYLSLYSQYRLGRDRGDILSWLTSGAVCQPKLEVAGLPGLRRTCYRKL